MTKYEEELLLAVKRMSNTLDLVLHRLEQIEARNSRKDRYFVKDGSKPVTSTEPPHPYTVTYKEAL